MKSILIILFSTYSFNVFAGNNCPPGTKFNSSKLRCEKIAGTSSRTALDTIRQRVKKLVRKKKNNSIIYSEVIKRMEENNFLLAVGELRKLSGSSCDKACLKLGYDLSWYIGEYGEAASFLRKISDLSKSSSERKKLGKKIRSLKKEEALWQKCSEKKSLERFYKECSSKVLDFIRRCNMNHAASCRQAGYILSIKKRTYARGLKYLKTGCYLSDGISCYLAGAYAHRDKNYSSASRYYEKSCSLASPGGCRYSGILYYYGKGRAVNYPKALEFFLKGCNMNDGTSCFYLGRVYYSGLGVPPSYSQALVFSEKACQLNSPDGCYNAARAYSKLYKYSVSTEMKVRNFYTRGCSLGYGYSCRMAFWYYAFSPILSKDFSQAIKILNHGCELKSQSACGYKGKLLLNGAVYKKDVEEGLRLLKKSCENKDGESCFILGLAYEHGRSGKKDLKVSLDWYLKGCQHRDASSCNNAGRQYYLGLGVKKDLAKAFSFYDSACSNDSGVACRNIGWMYKTGDGVGKNLDLSLKYFKKSCHDGDGSGCYETAAVLLDSAVTSRQKSRVYSYFSKSCKLKYSDGCGGKYYLMTLGYGTAKNLDLGLRGLLANCKEGNHRSCRWAAKYDENVYSSFKTISVWEVYDIFEQSCIKKNVSSCLWLKKSHSGDLNKLSPGSKYNKFSMLACKAGHKKSCSVNKKK
ncbi:MAG: sel1 repeat family protein [Deltaproteobacteria bacterium]|nr:sel1 repeat family protein [Deltaproteobacteria bacterium]